MDFITNRIDSWFSVEPILGMLMIITALIIFIQSYRKKQEKSSGKAWEWLRITLESLGTTLLFLGILWAFRAILNNNYFNFTQAHGRISEYNYQSVQNIWGGGQIQRELQIHHFIEVTRREEIPREDLSKPPLYRETQVQEEVEQNSILSFKGEVSLKMNMRKKGSAYYAGFESEFMADYEIINDYDAETDAHFTFPLSDHQAMYDKLMITENNRDLSSKLRFQSGSIRWDRKMLPNEKISIRIYYLSRGLDYFYYQIPEQREIRNFDLKLTLDRLALADVNYPEGCLPPTEKITKTADGKGVSLEWKLDRSVTTAGMGIALPSPEQPGVLETQVLKNSAYSLMFLITAVCLTLLIRRLRLNFIDISLVSAIYTLLFIIMSSLTDFFPAYIGFWVTLILGTALSVTLAFFLFRKYPPATSVCLLGLTGFFTLAYPLLNLIEGIENSLNGIIFIVLVVYVFVLRVLEKTDNLKQNQEQEL